MSGTLYLGTSGFAYPEWKGVFYPEGTKDREMLAYYASRFRSVEINYTFRRFPVAKTLANWRDQSQEGFQFTLKANQRITHTKRLKDADEDVGAFIETARVLGDRLGPILFQCPPNLKFDRDLIEQFLAYLPPIARYAMEFRHPSWDEARKLLADQGVAWCVAETDEKEGGEPAWEPFGYLRLRKLQYDDDEIKAWADRIAPALEDGRDVYCYFKHEDKGAGPIFAERLGNFIQ
ncbi:MAG: DUF72 domain-containing protein [Actinomycetota bacterium]